MRLQPCRTPSRAAAVDFFGCLVEIEIPEINTALHSINVLALRRSSIGDGSGVIAEHWPRRPPAHWLRCLIGDLTRILSYGDFWDVPRFFVVTIPDGLLVFRSPFDEDEDDYTDEYAVHFVPWSEADRLHGNWDALVTGTRRLGTVSVRDVEFDPTRRLQVATTVVDRFAAEATTEP